MLPQNSQSNELVDLGGGLLRRSTTGQQHAELDVEVECVGGEIGARYEQTTPVSNCELRMESAMAPTCVTAPLMHWPDEDFNVLGCSTEQMRQRVKVDLATAHGVALEHEDHPDAPANGGTNGFNNVRYLVGGKGDQVHKLLGPSNQLNQGGPGAAKRRRNRRRTRPDQFDLLLPPLRHHRIRCATQYVGDIRW